MSAKNERRHRIVIVDDDPDFLILAARWLKPAYDVTVVSDPEGALLRIAAADPDLVLLDVHMPEASGFEICLRVRNLPGYRELPVVFLTGSKTDEDYARHLQTGGSRYLTKPIGRETLLEALAEQLRGTMAA